MYTKMIFETAKEFFEACIPSPDKVESVIPQTVHIVFDSDVGPYLSGKGSEKFGLKNITKADLIAALQRLNDNRFMRGASKCVY